jgi:hypothetical protein
MTQLERNMKGEKKKGEPKFQENLYPIPEKHAYSSSLSTLSPHFFLPYSYNHPVPNESIS